MTFSPFHHGRQQIAGFAVVFVENEVDYLVVAVFHHFFARNVRIGFASASVEQTQKIVYFGDGANRRARIFARGFLLNGDDGTQTRNLVHIGALHVADEVARVGRKSLDVAALPFGVDGVECQRRLAAAAQTRNHRECIARNGGIDVAQVVNSRAINLYFAVVAVHFLAFCGIFALKKSNCKVTEKFLSAKSQLFSQNGLANKNKCVFLQQNKP